MKKYFSLIVLSVCTLLIVCLASCSESKNDIPTQSATEARVTEEAISTIGIYNDKINWRYDASTATLHFIGTGKMERELNSTVDGDRQYWERIAENIRLENGITDLSYNSITFYNSAKTLFLPASYVGELPEKDNLEKYIVDENNPVYSSDEHGVLFNKDKTQLIRYPRNNRAEIYSVPDGVTKILSNAFDSSRYLKNLTLPESVTSFPCTGFEDSSLYANPDNWEGDVFYVGDCLVSVDSETQAEHIIVKKGTRIINPYAFIHCKNIRSVTVPDSVKAIGTQAFDSCISLEKVYIGSGVETIGAIPFYHDIEGLPCESLESIEVSKDNKYYTSVDGVLFTKDMTALIQYPIAKEQNEYVIPDSVTKIGHGAFFECHKLKKLTIGKGMTIIDFIMLFGSESIETVILPETLTKLDGGAFKYSGIKYIDIPDSVTYLGSEAMTGCKRLETINIGKGVSYIDEAAIWSTALKEIKVDKDNKYFCDENGVLFSKDKTVLICYPPRKSGEVYHLPSTVRTIGCNAVQQADYLNEIHVGTNVEKIERGNFYSNTAYYEYGYETPYTVYYEGTQKQWESLFEHSYEMKNIDKSKVIFLQ